MPRSYQHISNYENEIFELKSQGLTLKEIGEKLGFTRKQVHNFICRYNEKQRNVKVGIGQTNSLFHYTIQFLHAFFPFVHAKIVFP